MTNEPAMESCTPRITATAPFPMKTSIPFLLLALLASPLSAQDWTILGNSGTNPAIHFVGTSDNKPVMFRINNLPAGSIGKLSSTFLGELAGEINAGTQNTGMGRGALSTNVSGTGNTALGNHAMEFAYTGSYNCSHGLEALRYADPDGDYNVAMGGFSTDELSSGRFNVAMGHSSLGFLSSGSDNIAIGSNALRFSYAGSKGVAIGAGAMYEPNNTATAYDNRNTAIGWHALYGSPLGSANIGNYSTMIGYEAGAATSSGGYNSAVGTQALWAVTTGSRNTAFGRYALEDVTTGSNNTGVGYSADVSLGTLSNATAFGYLTTVNASNKVRIGNGSVTVVEGQVPYSSPSDARFKSDVQEDVPGLDLVMKLRPVSYRFDRLAFAQHVTEPLEGRDAELAQASQARTTGFLAQEVEATVADLHYPAFNAVHAPENPTDNYSLAYAQFTVPLVKAVQELHDGTQLADAEMEAMRNDLGDRLDRLEKAVGQSAGQLRIHPVPANDHVRILPDPRWAGRPAELQLHDAAGKLQLHLQLPALEQDFVLPLPADLANGSYSLSISVHGEAGSTVPLLIAR
jgi:hypothetical protein